jgi:apolipoprotein N-acyltransferase
VQRFFQEVVGIQAIWAPGPETRLFPVERSRGDAVMVGTPVCFEDGFANVVRRFVREGADALINLTNNAWSRTDSAQLQHLVAARFRSVETRRSLIRSTNAGYTGVVDAWGRVTAGLPMFEGAHLTVEVPVYAPPRPTIYVLWGDYLPVTMLGGLLILLVVSRLRERAGRR